MDSRISDFREARRVAQGSVDRHHDSQRNLQAFQAQYNDGWVEPMRLEESGRVRSDWQATFERVLASDNQQQITLLGRALSRFQRDLMAQHGTKSAAGRSTAMFDGRAEAVALSVGARLSEEQNQGSVRARQLFSLLAQRPLQPELIAHLVARGEGEALAEANRLAAQHLMLMRNGILQGRLYPAPPNIFLDRLIACIAAGRPWPRVSDMGWVADRCVHTAALSLIDVGLILELCHPLAADPQVALGCPCDAFGMSIHLVHATGGVLHGLSGWGPGRIEHLRRLLMQLSGALAAMGVAQTHTLLISLFGGQRKAQSKLRPQEITLVLTHLWPSLAPPVRRFLLGLAARHAVEQRHANFVSDLDCFGLNALDQRCPEPLGEDVSGCFADTLLHLVARQPAEHQASLLAGLGPSQALRALRYGLEGAGRVSHIAEEPLMVAAGCGHGAMVRWLTTQMAAQSVEQADETLLWESRVGRLKATCARFEEADAPALAEGGLLEMAEALSQVILVDASLREAEGVEGGMVLLRHTEQLLFQLWAHAIDRPAPAERSHEPAAGPSQDVALVERRAAPMPVELVVRLRAMARLYGRLAPQLSMLSSPQSRREARVDRYAGLGADAWLKGVAERLSSGRMPRLTQTFLLYGESATQLLLAEGPPPTADERLTLAALLLERQSRPRQGPRSAQHAALLAAVAESSEVARAPELLTQLTLMAVAFDALPCLKTWWGTRGWRQVASSTKNRALCDALLSRCESASSEMLLWIIHQLPSEALGQAVGHIDEGGDSLLHRLARQSERAVAAVMARLGEADRRAAAAISNISGRTAAEEALAYGRPRAFESLCEAATPDLAWQKLSAERLEAAMLAFPGRSVVPLLAHRREGTQIASALAPRWPRLLGALAEQGALAPLLFVARREPDLLLAGAGDDSNVFCGLARRGVPGFVHSLAEILGKKKACHLLKRGDGRGRPPEAHASDPETLLALKALRERATPEARTPRLRLPAAAQEAYLQLISATSALSAERAMEAFSAALESTSALWQQAELATLVNDRAWQALEVVARWGQPGMGCHFAAHHPRMGLAALRTRAERRELSGSLRFNAADGVALLLARQKILRQAQAALREGRLRWGAMALHAELQGAQGGDGFVRQADGQALTAVTGATWVRFVVVGRQEAVFMVSVYPCAHALANAEGGASLSDELF